LKEAQLLGVRRPGGALVGGDLNAALLERIQTLRPWPPRTGQSGARPPHSKELPQVLNILVFPSLLLSTGIIALQRW